MTCTRIALSLSWRLILTPTLILLLLLLTLILPRIYSEIQGQDFIQDDFAPSHKLVRVGLVGIGRAR